MAADPLDLYFAASEATVAQGLNMADAAFQVFGGGFTEEALGTYLKMVVPTVLNMKMQQARLTSAFFGRRTGNPPVVPDPQSVLQRGLITPSLAEARDMLSRQYVRPFVAGRTEIARGAELPDAMRVGQRRLKAMVDTDSQMAKVRQARDSLAAYDIENYRRVTHSAKPCRLCLIASTQTYHRKNLMPIHDHCRCSVDVMPDYWNPREIVIPPEYMEPSKRGKRRGGKAVREDDLARWFRDMHEENSISGFNQAFEELIAVREHGEIGPVLTWKDHHFKSIPPVLGTRVIAFEPTVEHGRPSKRAVWGPIQSPAELLPGWYQLHPDIQLVGFNDIEFVNPAQEQVVAMRLRDFLMGVDDTIRRFPALEGKIPPIVWGDCYYSGDTAETWPATNKAGTRITGSSKITLQPDYFLDPDMAREGQKRWYEDHPLAKWQSQPGVMSSPDQPFDWTVAVHEIGHVISNMGGKLAEGDVMIAISEAFDEAYPNARNTMSAKQFQAEMRGFIKRNMSGYARGEFDAQGNRTNPIVNKAEALAEGFLDVESGGNNATPISQKLYDRLLTRAGLSRPTTVFPDTGGVPYRYGGDETLPPYTPPAKKRAAVLHPRDAGFNTVDLHAIDLGDGVTLYSTPEGLRTTPKAKPIPVEWTGPPIAEPSTRGGIRDNVDIHWLTQGFDESKIPMREGARLAEYEGYKPGEIDIVTSEYYDWLKKNEHAAVKTPFRVSDDALRAEGKELVARAVYAKPTVQKFYRGIRVTDEAAAALKAGDILSMELSSFTTDDWESGSFARGEGWKSKDIDGKPHGIEFVLEPGAKLGGFPSSFTGSRTAERVGFGQFEITRVERDAAPGRDRVYIRQTSMIEKPVADARPAPMIPPGVDFADLEATVYDKVRKSGGVTINLAGREPTEGYAYAPYKNTEVVIPQAEFTPAHVDKFIEDHYDELSKRGNNLGLWVEKGNVYIDVSRVGAPTAATIERAQKADQLAVFDLKNFKQIDIGTVKNGTYRRTDEAASIHRQYREQVSRRDEGAGAGGARNVPGRGAAGAGAKPRVEKPRSTAGPRPALAPNPQAPQPPRRAGAVVTAMTAEDLKPQDVASLRRFDLEDLGETVKPVPKMNKDGTFRTNKSGEPVIDWEATWKQVPGIQVTLDGQVVDPVLEANFRRVLVQALGTEWARESGQVWYPEYGQFVAKELSMSGRKDLTLEQAINASAAFAINASWNETMANFHMWVNGIAPPKADPRFAQADKAVTDPNYWHRPGANAPKIDDFCENGKGDYSRSTTDRWMARIGAGTDDGDLAAGLLGAGNAGSYVDPVTGKTVKLDGYNRLSEAMTRVANEYGIEPAAAQAMVWIEYFGPEASYGLPPDDVVAKGKTALNQWVRERTLEQTQTGGLFQVQDGKLVVLPGIRRKPPPRVPQLPPARGQSSDNLKDLLRPRPVR